MDMPTPKHKNTLFLLPILFIFFQPSLAFAAEKAKLFAPDRCEYQVVFPSAVESEESATDKSTVIKAYFNNYKYSLVANCTIFNDLKDIRIDDRTLYVWGKAIANRRGIQLADVTTTKLEMGRLVQIEGALLAGNIAYIIKIYAYYGRSSRMMLEIKSEAKRFPTQEMLNFLTSFEKVGHL